MIIQKQICGNNLGSVSTNHEYFYTTKKYVESGSWLFSGKILNYR